MIGEKDVKHCIFKEHAMRQGMRPSLERFAVRMRIKHPGMGKIWIFAPRAQKTVSTCVQTSNCCWH